MKNNDKFYITIEAYLIYLQLYLRIFERYILYRFGSNALIYNTITECTKIYRKSILHLVKYRFAVYLSTCSTDLRFWDTQ